MEINKTGYEWCVLQKIRPLDLSEWDGNKGNVQKLFFEELIPYTEFLTKIRSCKIKPNSTPRKPAEYLIYRLYGFVPYNISDIQKGIQFGHATVEYGQRSKVVRAHEVIYDKFANVDKTFIILDGGSTNNNPERPGTLQKIMARILEYDIKIATFYEPDLNDALTAFVFLVDERVFDRETYPDFVRNDVASDEQNYNQYTDWVEKIGGPTNVFLRSYLPTFKLA